MRFEPVFFVVILLLGLGQEPRFLISWVLVATVSILVHEMGHAVAFRAYGLTPRVVLHGMGGLTTGEGALSPSARIVTSLAGPVSALVLLGLPAVIMAGAGVASAGAARTVLDQVVWINVGWSVLNLVPVLPLDGGQVFLAVCDLATKGRGRRVAEIVSVGVAALIGVWAYSQGFLFGALLAGGLGALNLSQLRKVRQEELLDELSTAHRFLLEERLTDADEVLARVAGARPSGEARRWWVELTAWSAVFHGRPPPSPPPSPGAEVRLSASLTAAQALRGADPDGGVALAAWAFAHD